ncbi:MAG: winged helix-turn-helix domain-containing protein [Candidatus Woesearchaeota archaeon]
MGQISNKKRERLGVIFDILKNISEHYNSIRSTPLQRQSNLSTATFNEYYSELLAKEFIKEILDKKGKKHITLTDKGFRFLEKYRMIKGLIEEFEL